MPLQRAHQSETVRIAVTVQRAAAMLDCSDNTVRAMVKAGELEGFRLRGMRIRVYEDSIHAYKDGRKITSSVEEKQARITGTKQQKEALNYLQSMGCG